jgi:hypothetical protein
MLRHVRQLDAWILILVGLGGENGLKRHRCTFGYTHEPELEPAFEHPAGMQCSQPLA